MVFVGCVWHPPIANSLNRILKFIDTYGPHELISIYDPGQFVIFISIDYYCKSSAINVLLVWELTLVCIDRDRKAIIQQTPHRHPRFAET